MCRAPSLKLQLSLVNYVGKESSLSVFVFLLFCRLRQLQVRFPFDIKQLGDSLMTDLHRSDVVILPRSRSLQIFHQFEFRVDSSLLSKLTVSLSVVAGFKIENHTVRSGSCVDDN